MPRFTLGILLGIAVFSAAPAHAQDPHPRRARVVYLLGDRPAVLLEDDRAWAPDSGGGVALSVCAGNACARVVSTTACAPPECPSLGSELELERDLASVDGFPTDVEGFDAEIAAMRSDPLLAQLPFSSHPESGMSHETDDQHGLSFHVGLGGTLASRGSGGGLLAGASGELGLRFGMDPDDGLVETLLGDRATLVVRGGYLHPTLPQRSEALGFVGGSIELENRIRDASFQVPSLVSLVLPEMGVLIRAEDGPSFYARWSVPVKIAIGDAAGAEVRFEWMIAEAANPDDGTESIVGLSLGGFIQ